MLLHCLQSLCLPLLFFSGDAVLYIIPGHLSIYPVTIIFNIRFYCLTGINKYMGKSMHHKHRLPQVKHSCFFKITLLNSLASCQVSPTITSYANYFWPQTELVDYITNQNCNTITIIWCCDGHPNVSMILYMLPCVICHHWKNILCHFLYSKVIENYNTTHTIKQWRNIFFWCLIFLGDRGPCQFIPSYSLNEQIKVSEHISGFLPLHHQQRYVGVWHHHHHIIFMIHLMRMISTITFFLTK